MTSIRARLLLTLLPSLLVLGALSGYGLYRYVRKSLYQSIDNELRLVADALPAILRRAAYDPQRDSNRREARPPRRSNQFIEGGNFYYQAWFADGRIVTSESLGERTLEKPSEFTRERVLSSQSGLRSIHQRIKAPLQTRGRGRSRRPLAPVEIILARDTSDAEDTLSKLRWGIGLTSIFTLLGSILAIEWSIRRSLKPVSALGQKLSDIDSENLDQRLPAESSPRERSIVPEKVNELLSRLEAAFERERRFGGDLAHELRTPTAEIKALTEVGLTWPDQFGEEELRDIGRSAARMEKTTDALMELTRLAANEAPVKESLVVRPLVSELMNDFRKAGEQRNLQLSLLEGEDVSVETHLGLLRIILQNLLSNAITYAPEGDEIVIDLTAEGLTIANAAPDLSEEDIPHLFERFWRKDKARTSDRHAGLGLQLVTVCAEKLEHRLLAELEGQRLAISIRW